MAWDARTLGPWTGCLSRRLREEGFVFEFPELRGALQDLFRSARQPSSPGRA